MLSQHKCAFREARVDVWHISVHVHPCGKSVETQDQMMTGFDAQSPCTAPRPVLPSGPTWLNNSFLLRLPVAAMIPQLAAARMQASSALIHANYCRLRALWWAGFRRENWRQQRQVNLEEVIIEWGLAYTVWSIVDLASCGAVAVC